MKLKIIGDKKNNRILIPRTFTTFYDIHESLDLDYGINNMKRESKCYKDNNYYALSKNLDNFEEEAELNEENGIIMDFNEYKKTENLTTKKRKRSKGIKKKQKKKQR